MTTPSGARIIARLADGTEVNVTEDVQTLYDLVTGSNAQQLQLAGRTNWPTPNEVMS